jgi:lipoprotein-releasing system permease protein
MINFPDTHIAPKSKPFSAFERMVAWRYLRSRRKEAFISVIAGFSFVGIVLGVATLIVVMAVMNGFRAELLTRILGINGHIIVQPIDRPLDDYVQLSQKFEAIKDVSYSLPLVEGQTLASGTASQGTGVLVRGIQPSDISKIKLVSQTVKQGSFKQFGKDNGVAIGARMAENLGLKIGNMITLVSPNGDITPFGTTPRVKSYPIMAIFEIGMSEYDSSIVFMPLFEAQNYFNLDGKVQSIEIIADNPDNLETIKQDVELVADRQIMLTDWRQRNVTFFSALEVERNVMFMILTLIVLVAALNIVSGLIMLVKDKGRDIAILRTMGATRGMILRIFLMAGSAIGMIGTLVGFLLGVMICLNIESIRQFFSWLSGTSVFNPELYFLSQLPAKMDSYETITVIVMALFLSFVATLFPAWRAAKLDPIEALRYE